MKINSPIKHTIVFIVFFIISVYNAYASSNFFVVPPSTTQNRMQDVSIPLTMNNLSNMDIRSIELNISYDPEVLTATGLSLTGTVLENQNYLYEFNSNISGIIYALFASNASHFTGTGLCLNLDFTVIGTAGETSDITISTAIVNNQAVSTSDGILTVAYDTPPMFTGIVPQTMDENESLSTSLTINDYESNPCDLTLTITSSDESVVQANTISYTCMSGNYFFSITPVADQNGLVIITITAEDSGGLTASASFDLTITAINAPVIANAAEDFSGQTMNEDTNMTVSYLIDDSDSRNITISAMSSDTSIVSNGNITWDYILEGTQEFVVNTGETIVAGDVVAYINGNILKGGAGLISDFFTTSPNTMTEDSVEFNSAARLDDSRFIVAYKTTNIKVKIGTLEGTNIIWGDEYTFSTSYDQWSTVGVLDSSKVVIVYKKQGNLRSLTAIIGEISGNSISFGTPKQMNPDYNTAEYISLAVLNDSAFAIAYRNGNAGGSIHVVIGNVTGTTISNGDQYTIDNIMASSNSIAALNESKFVLAYSYHYEEVGSDNSYCVVGEVSGTSISWGNTYSYNTQRTQHLSLAVMNENKFILAYQDLGNAAKGTALIAEVSGTVISYNTPQIFNNATTEFISMSKMNDTSVAIAFNTSNKGKAIVGDVDGTTLSWSGIDEFWSSTYIEYVSCEMVNDTQFVVLYKKGSGGNGLATIGSFETIYPIGLASSDGIAGEQVTVVNYGVVEGLSGLTENDLYYADDNGNLTTSVTSHFIGTALSSNALIIQSDIPGGTSLFNTSNSCTITLTPTKDQWGSLTITVQVTNSQGLTAVDSFGLTVLSVNDPPVIGSISDQTTLEEDTTIGSISLTVSDIEDAPCTMDISITSSDTSILPNENISYICDSNTYTLTMTPAADQNGVVSISFEVTDSGTLTAIRTFDITITAVNDAPTLANPISDRIATEGTYYSFTFDENTFADVDTGDTMTYAARQSNGSALPAWLSFDSATRTFSGTPDNNNVGSISITITATDGSGQSATDIFQLTVSNTNSAPVLDNPIVDQTSLQDELFSFTFSADTFRDDDAGDSISYTAIQADGSALPFWLTFDTDNRTFTGTPSNYDVGMYTITVIAEDTSGLTAEDSFYLTIDNVNDAPEINDIYRGVSNISLTGLTIDEDSQVNDITFSIYDIDDSNLTVSLTSSNTTLVPNSSMDYSCSYGSCTMSLTPVSNENGSAIITVTVSDPEGLTASNAFDLNVTPINDHPVMTSITGQTIDEDTVADAISFSISDVDDTDLSVSLTSSNTILLPLSNMHHSCINNSCTMALTPAANENGSAMITVTVTDPKGLTTSTDFNLTVTSINDVPTLSAIAPQNIDEGESIQVSFMAEDIESSTLFITASSSNQVLISDENLTLTHDDNLYTITVTPHKFQVGQTGISISVSDGTDSTSTKFTVTVNETHYTISGHVSSYTDIAGSNLQNVVMTLSGTYSYSSITDESGNYAFTTVRPDSYTLTASKSGDFSLDLADAIKILKGAVKLINLTCYEQIAADAYIDGYFGAFDASKVAHYVGGLEECLNDDCIFWRFIPEEIPSCEAWPLIEIKNSRQYIDLTEDAYNQDFIGIGCGNVSQ